jgi:hypothetical protein
MISTTTDTSESPSIGDSNSEFHAESKSIIYSMISPIEVAERELQQLKNSKSLQ